MLSLFISLYIFGFLFVVWRWFFFTLLKVCREENVSENRSRGRPIYRVLYNIKMCRILHKVDKIDYYRILHIIKVIKGHILKGSYRSRLHLVYRKEIGSKGVRLKNENTPIVIEEESCHNVSNGTSIHL